MPIQKETGTLVYILHEHDTEPDALVFYELYENADGARGPQLWAGVEGDGPEVRAFMAGRPEIVRLTPVAGKGL